MTALEQRTILFIEETAHAHYMARDINAVLNVLDEGISWIGTGVEELCSGMADAQRLLREDVNELPDGFQMDRISLFAKELSPTLCLVYGDVDMVQNGVGNGTPLMLNLRVSALVEERDGKLVLLHFHLSMPDRNQEEGTFYPNILNQQARHALQRLVDEKNREVLRRRMEVTLLAANIPGAAMRCLHDENHTISYMSDGLSVLYGYTREEIERRYQNQYRRMVHPEDWPMVEEAIVTQLEKGNTVEVEYRGITKDDAVIWILDKRQLITGDEGPDYFYSVLVDITKTKTEEEERRLTEARYRIVMEQTSDVVFEWDLVTDDVIFSKNFVDIFGYPPTEKDFTRYINQGKNIHPEDMEGFQQFLMDVLDDDPYIETEFRIKKADGSYIWCRLKVSTLYDEEGRPIRAVGVIVNVDEAVRQSQLLMAKAELDTFTGLYNKASFQQYVAAYMRDHGEREQHSLFIIDVDNFKVVNDRVGHLGGDAVLLDLAAAIPKLFRGSDLVGRIGGDEFAVFVKEIPSRAFLEQKGQEILEAIQNIAILGDEAYALSCSVGIAVFPDDGTDFNEIYRKADVALYEAKERGKNQCAIYDGEMEKTRAAAMQDGSKTAISDTIDTQARPEMFLDGMTEYIFRVMYNADDLDHAIRLILEIIGRYYDVSRVYIFENEDDARYCSNTYEWCNDGVEPAIDNLQNLSYVDDLDDCMSFFDEDGVFYCEDVENLPPRVRAILEPQGIYSMLQCAIKDNGDWKGLIGFDECRKNRVWLKEQVDTLSFIADILAAYLTRQRARSRMERTMDAMLQLVDGDERPAYIVDGMDYTLLYQNPAMAREPAGRVEDEVHCYNALYQKDAPCAHCPIPKGESVWIPWGEERMGRIIYYEKDR
ncbi:diguanylate cyclase [Eubacteriales bacterium OttesenSCG-928-M02]|nr:diguanylate cyclase [Eubacteriales bacterium OttesenSCG-928-M02]